MRALTRLIGALGICAASFFATVWLIDVLNAPEEDITIVAATYGSNCATYKVAPPARNTVAPGNVTNAIGSLCTGKKGNCTFLVDVARIGDPAPGCAKDLSVSWRCSGGPETNEYRLPPEAHGNELSVSCPPD